jgi:protein-tyrosine-phosphatase
MNTDGGNLEDIEDPMGQSRPVYQRVYRQIRKELERILPALVKWPGG